MSVAMQRFFRALLLVGLIGSFLLILNPSKAHAATTEAGVDSRLQSPISQFVDNLPFNGSVKGAIVATDATSATSRTVTKTAIYVAAYNGGNGSVGVGFQLFNANGVGVGMGRIVWAYNGNDRSLAVSSNTFTLPGVSVVGDNYAAFAVVVDNATIVNNGVAYGQVWINNVGQGNPVNIRANALDSRLSRVTARLVRTTVNRRVVVKRSAVVTLNPSEAPGDNDIAVIKVDGKVVKRLSLVAGSGAQTFTVAVPAGRSHTLTALVDGTSRTIPLRYAA